ncbi:DHA2 family efflux MFS transporter permease subunit [Bailinhaonella thermotolerans]|uniref:DHA2 family efflux MFS transporter permease subunit n=1 Tax=Bailinhaonella thermotolerans TaxID=1070861 RepID=A0A3A4A2A2_9ACTN|nr:DHA2 family efflux MFS transporter permease subunit [Bailinhaonella thermotolerans]RJL22816.1 DHA2 family efflux MFS transporter permease subunit [Bailinhaonella thermotolerans]
MSQAPAATLGAPQPPKEPAGRRGHGHPWLTLLAVALGVIMVMLDGTVVAIANPAIAADLGASIQELQWVTSGYLLALAVFLITAGKLGDLFGHKAVFMVGIAGFALTSLAIGLSSGVGWLIAFRVLQGLFGALLQPAALALLRTAFPAEKLNMAIGIWGAAIGVSSAAGPIVGGLLVEHVSWQSVFYINVPVGLIAFAVGIWVLKESKAGLLSRIDIPGVILLSGAMFCLIWAIIKAPEWGWADGATLGFFAGALVLTVLFVVWQMFAKEPLLPLGLFRSASLSIGTVLMVLVAFSMFGAMFFLTFFLQNVHGLSPLESGLRMMPMSAGMIVASPLAGFLIGKLGPKIPIAGGMLITATAMFLLSRLDIDAGYGQTALPFVLLAFGLSPVMVGATEIIVGNAAPELSGVAGGLQQSAMQVGGSLGTAVLGAVMASKVGDVLPGHFTALKLPAPPPEQIEAMKQPVSMGIAPITPQMNLPAPVAELITKAAHLSFMDGLHLAFTVSTVVAVVAAALGLIVKAGRKSEDAVQVHI